MYDIYLQSQASKELKKLSKREKKRHEDITDVLDLLSVDPFGDSVKLKDEMFQGLRRAKAGEDRILFLVCEECRSGLLMSEDDKCIDCDDIPENGVKIFNIIPRKHAYRRR